MNREIVGEALGAGVRFSEALREATEESHALAKQAPIMQALLTGKLARDRYVDLLAQQYFVYVALEAAGRAMAADPVAGAFVHPALDREPALAEDLAGLLGADWQRDIAPSEATRVYCARIHEVCLDWPGDFVAHHYVRYLGDLSGGQVIGLIARRTFGIGDGPGSRFYVFDGIANANAFKQDYRALLDRQPWDAGERGRIIAEAQLAYQLNIDVLSSL